MNSNLIKVFHFQVVLRHSQLEYQSNRRLNKSHHLNQQTFFQIHQLQLNYSILLLNGTSFDAMLIYALKLIHHFE